MKMGREEKSHETSPGLTRFGHGGDIDIPMELTVEILKRLPAKSLVRFQSVSKEWSSIISRRRDFIESIVSRSLTQRPLERDAHIISHYGSGRRHLALSSNTYTDKELLLLPGEYGGSVRGLIFCWSRSRSHPNVVAMYNPTTRQSFYLPEVKAPRTWYGCIFGYDPLENQYKVVLLPDYTKGESCLVFTLGTKQWKTIQGYNTSVFPVRDVVCINGTIYYQEGFVIKKLMSFDVRSEIFHHHVEEAPTRLIENEESFLINYQGKLGFICCDKGVEIWVMETRGWSKIFSWEMMGFARRHVSGVTRGGEIVFDEKTMYVSHHLLCVYYYDPERNSMRRVNLQDYYLEERKRNCYIPKESRRRLRYRQMYHKLACLTLPDHVENTMCLQ